MCTLCAPMRKTTIKLKTKDHSIKTRIDTASLKALQKKAAGEGVTVSEMVRRAIRQTYQPA